MGALESAREAAFATGQNPTQDGVIIFLRQGYARSSWGKVCWWLIVGEVEGTPQWPLAGTTSLHEQLCLVQPTIIPAAPFHADSYWVHRLPGLVYLGSTAAHRHQVWIWSWYMWVFRPAVSSFPAGPWDKPGPRSSSDALMERMKGRKTYIKSIRYF